MNTSKYDHKGNVIYSESLDLEGMVVRHFYKYDQNDRRIYYKAQTDTSIFEEYTTYNEHGIKVSVTTYKYPEYLYCERHFNSMGRVINEIIIDNLTGQISYKKYDVFRDKYIMTKAISPFVIYNNSDRQDLS